MSRQEKTMEKDQESERERHPLVELAHARVSDACQPLASEPEEVPNSPGRRLSVYHFICIYPHTQERKSRVFTKKKKTLTILKIIFSPIVNTIKLMMISPRPPTYIDCLLAQEWKLLFHRGFTVVDFLEFE